MLLDDRNNRVANRAQHCIRLERLDDEAVHAARERGLGTVGERMLIMLDIDKLLGSEEMGLLAAAKEAA